MILLFLFAKYHKNIVTLLLIFCIYEGKREKHMNNEFKEELAIWNMLAEFWNKIFERI